MRTIERRGLLIKSNLVDDSTGLGILDEGVDHFFRVAVENVNGRGQFSSDVILRILRDGEVIMIHS